MQEIAVREGTLPLPTGPLLEGFLKVAGSAMQAAYGKQFIKLLMMIQVRATDTIQLV